VNSRDGSSVGLAEGGAERVARMYATLSMAYEAIVRIRQRLPLFEEVCRVLVERGHLRMAWVGEVDDQGWIIPTAHAGVADGYLDQLRISVCDVPEGRGPTGTAARELRHMLVTDIATDERMAPWREAALARGYRSSAAFPLVLDGRCVAVLTAYASEAGFFDEQQVELFDRLAADLSFASEAMEREERRRAAEAELQSSEERSRAAEAQLRSSEERFRAAAGSLLDSFTIVSPVRDPRGEIIDFRHEYVNDAYCALVGFDRERLLAHRLGELFPHFPGSDRLAVYRRVAETGEPSRTEAVHGQKAWAGTLLATRVVDTVIVPLGENLVVSARDVTERKRDEQELRLRGELLDLAHDAVIVRDPVESRVTFWNREAEKIYGYSREEATGRVTHELLATEFPEPRESVEEVLAREGRWDGELRHTRKDGTVIVISSRQALARDEAGRPLAIIELNSDITARKRAEEQLAHTAGLLGRTEEISKTGGWEYDVATGNLAWTDEVYRIYGLEPTSDPPDVPEAIASYDSDSAASVEAAFARLVADGEPYDLELGLVRADGERIWVRTIGRPVIEDGRVVRVGGQIADITERKRAEQELQLRAELLDLAHDAVIVRDPVESRVAFWNREAENIYGYSRAEAVGQVTHDLLAAVFPDSLEAVDETLAREGRWDGELRHTRKDGRVITVSSRHALARDEHGRPIAIIELNSDITERKRAEEELAETAGLLERTQQISKTGGWEYHLATSQLTLTDEVYRIYGSSEQGYGPVEPDRVFSAFDADSAPIISAALERLIADGEPSDLEVGLVRADGQRIWVRVVGEAVIEGGRVVRVRGIIADVDDRRLAEEEIRALNAELEQRVAARTTQLERVNHELETFAYSVSHDLRAPLRAVDGFSKVLLDDYAEKLGGEGRHYLERVRAGAVRMGTLIDEILKLSRLSRQRFEREPIDMSALAREIVAELSSVEPDRRVEVEIEDGLVAEADRGLVQSVLQNLLGNAFKFTTNTERARVRVGAVEQDGVPVYFVADNGAGFDMAHAKALFRPFQRLHRESEFPGTGIGLATVVRAVHRHGGAIWAHGAVNRGATFHFTLMPGAQPPADAATGEDVAPRWPPTDGEGSR
jgi:PAS domain S-box-containing protein